MRTIVAVLLGVVLQPVFALSARAQSLDEIFRRINPSVIVVRSKGHDVNASGVTRFNEIGSGFLISDSGRVMTAAHVVNGMDEVTVEGSRVRSSAPRSSRRMRRPTSRSCSSNV